MDAGRLRGVHLFPVRHHSPRSSAALAACLHSVAPRVVLVEGPADAAPLIEPLTDDDTRPPVAILGYRTDGTSASALWPFASYSPEYVALRWARRHRALARFIDIPIGQSLALDRCADAEAEEEGGDTSDAGGDGADSAAGSSSDGYGGSGSGSGGDAGEAAPVDVHAAVAEARGFRSFDEFWEASFEAPAWDEGSFRAALLAWAEVVRAAGSRPADRGRDVIMARAIVAAQQAGARPEEMVVVAGAAHVAALAAGELDEAAAAALPEAVPSACTLIPYSFPRLAAQTGYGAGNRAPRFYQRAHDAGCDFNRAALEALVEFAEHLRLRGFSASLADTIEAYRLAMMLAQIRGKPAPGLDEVREAAVATLCRGEVGSLERFLWPGVIGHDVGKLAAVVGRTSLQEEFWREVDERRLPRSDAAEVFSLRLSDPLEMATSVFLHRLRVAGIPYASFTGSHAGTYPGGRGTGGASRADKAGGLSALSRARESWEAQWTPATDVELVEKIVLGDTLEEVATRLLRERLAGATGSGGAAELLMESVVAGCSAVAGEALAACDRLASVDDDLPSLAAACRALSGLSTYGSSRRHAALGDQLIAGLCRRTFERSLLRVSQACTGSDQAVTPACAALRILHEVALGQPLLDRQAWLDVAAELMASWTVNAAAAGLAAGLLYLARAISEEQVALVLGQRLSAGSAAAAAAGFLAGFLSVNALVLVKSREVVKALDDYLVAMPAERFRDVLPVLRRALGELGQSERRYLLENIVALRGLGGAAAAARKVVEEKDKEKLREMSGELAKAMDDLDDLL